MIKKLIRKMILGPKASSESYVNYLRDLGMTIGMRTVFFYPTKTTIDLTRPWMIEIGDDVQITEGVTILTHGYDWSVLKGVYGEVLGSAGKVKIGNNVFIGMHSTILKGVTVGNNVIIGANSLVNKDIPNNCVVAGNPAKIIMTIEEYYKKRKKAQYEEAKELVKEYRLRYKKDPQEYELYEFFWLFSSKEDKLHSSWERAQNLVGNRSYSDEVFQHNEKMFENMEEFLKSIK